MADLLSSADDHTERAGSPSCTAALRAAATAGADVRRTASPAAPTTWPRSWPPSLVVPLRERIERSFEASDGDLDTVADRVKALYREWKIQRSARRSAAGLVVAAYARGVFDGRNKGAKVRWVVDPSRGPCPDCDDNVLAGVVVKGEAFPTGQPARSRASRMPLPRAGARGRAPHRLTSGARRLNPRR